MKRGLYAIFEGIDGCGKTSTMLKASEELAKRLSGVAPELEIVNTHNPGSTPLGKHIRQLIRHPEEIDPNIEIDHLSRQVLYLADTVSFIKSILEPSLEAKKVVFADRSSYISGLAFGCADGLPLEEIGRLYSLVVPPLADRLYIFSCRVEEAMARVQDDGRKKDRYDKLGHDYHRKVAKIYDGLATAPPEVLMLVNRCVALDNIVYVDASVPQEQVVEFVVGDLVRVLSERERFTV